MGVHASLWGRWLVPLVSVVCTSCTTDTRPATASGDSFRDCDDCPWMVSIPAGNFVMGSPTTELGRGNDEAPHTVTIERAFAVGKFEVSRGEYASFVEATGRGTGEGCYIRTEAPTSYIAKPTADGSLPGWRQDAALGWHDPGFPQADDHPVVCVSWQDAQAYTVWLSEKTSESYRLLSDAEWEYAARAGTTTARHWGESATEGCGHANGADLSLQPEYPNWPIVTCEDGYVYTAAVGSLTANAFGLHDMLGNVLEWVTDCWQLSHQRSDGAAILEGDCSSKALRGGSWYDGPKMLRSANRYGYSATSGNYSLGFRIARSLQMVNNLILIEQERSAP